MSRCKACNRKMTELELCRKVYSPITERTEYVDLCTNCTQPTDDVVESYRRYKREVYEE